MPIKNGQKERFIAANIEQVNIECIVKNLIKDPIRLVYYIIFGKQIVKARKKHKGATLLTEIEILQRKWYARGLNIVLMDGIKDALNVPYDMGLTEEWLNLHYLRLDCANSPLTGPLGIEDLVPVANITYDIGTSAFKIKDIWCDGIYFAANRYLIWDIPKNQLTMRAPEKINFQISDVVVFNVTYTSADVNSGLPLKFKIGGKFCGFRPVAVPDNNVWVLPAADAAGYWKSDGADNLSISNPLYSEVKRSDCVTYLDCVETLPDNIVGASLWATDPAVIPALQPVNVRNVQATVFPDLMQTVKGTITIDGVDSDGKVAQQVFVFDTAAMETQHGDVQFAYFTNIAVVKDPASGTGMWWLGIGNRIGLQNYPFNASSDIVKVSKNGAYYNPVLYTVDTANGMILDTLAIGAGARFTIWYRPYK